MSASSTITPTPTAPAAEPLDLATERAIVEQTLARLEPAADADAEAEADNRSVIEDAFGFAPTDREFATLLGLAHQPPSPGPQFELAHTALALRVALEHEVRVAFDGAVSAGAGQPQAVNRLLACEKQVRTLGRVIAASKRAVAGDDRELLERVDELLRGPRERLMTAVLLAPGLATAPPIQAGAPVNHTVRLATLLREVILETVAQAEASDDGSRVRLEQARVAYRVVAERLQAAQDNALGTGHDIEALRVAKQELFAAFIQLKTALRDEPSGGDDPGDESLDAAELDRLLAESSVVDAAADAERARRGVTAEEAALNALADMKQPAARSNVLQQAPSRYSERRTQALAVTAGVLLIACIAFYGSRLQQPAAQFDIPAAELDGGPRVQKAFAIGPMLYAEISRSEWDELDEAARIQEVTALASSAVERGLDTLFVTDDSRADLARWSRSEGVQLLERDEP